MIGILLFAMMTERAVAPGGAGPNRLDPDVSVLVGASPLRYATSTEGLHKVYSLTGGLEDLRLHEANGSEHPYLLIAPPTRQPRWKTASIMPIAATKVASGFEADFGSLIEIDRLRVEGIATPFLKRLRLEGSGDRAHWTVLAPEATLFDLPEQQLRNLDVAFNAGAFRYLRVTWDDRSSARVPQIGNVSAELYEPARPAAPRRVAIPFRSESSETGKSRYRVSLPGAHFPVVAVEIQVNNPNVYRDASITEPRLAGSAVEPVVLGSSKLRRAERDDAVAEDLTIPISFPEGPDLEVVVDDGSNPPLSITGMAAILAPLPWIYFESVDHRPLAATYGDPSLKRPSYDLEARRVSASQAALAHATWSSAPAASRPAANTAAIPVGGAPVDRKGFRFTRSIGPTQPGLTSLLLDADVFARSTALRDVRIVAANDQQVPYLVERRDGPSTLLLRVPRRTRGEGTRSIYRFVLPYDTLPEGTRLVITTTAHVFERTAALSRAADETRGRDRETIQTQTWRSSDPEATPPPLTFDAPLSGTRAVDLELDEGDNAPLPIATAQLLLPSYALRFISPGGPLTLLYGNPSSTAPRYDLAILAPQLFGESSREISLTRAAPMIATSESGTERKIFWVVIALAVVALLITLGRLLSSGVTASEP